MAEGQIHHLHHRILYCVKYRPNSAITSTEAACLHVSHSFSYTLVKCTINRSQLYNCSGRLESFQKCEIFFTPPQVKTLQLFASSPCWRLQSCQFCKLEDHAYFLSGKVSQVILNHLLLLFQLTQVTRSETH